MAAIDLSLLPAPEFVEQLDYETILAEMLADARERAAAKGVPFDTISEADPAYIVLEVAAYRELGVRQRGNEEGRALLLAFAQGADLTHIGITYYDREPRLVIVEADPTANPPVDEVLEDDDSYKRRLMLKDDGYSTAGATNAYKFHALSASGRVKDVAVDSPHPGTTVIYVLSRDGDGTADDELIALVDASVQADDVRPLSEEVIVRSAEIVHWSWSADLYVFNGPDQALVLQAAIDSGTEFKEKTHVMENSIALSALYAALHMPGVAKVVLNDLNADVVCGLGQAPYCDEFTLRIAGQV